MKKIAFSILIASCVSAFAQETVPFAMVKPDASATYALMTGNKKKLMNNYLKVSVSKVEANEDGSKLITNRIDWLDKKKQISKYSSMVGTSNGFYYAIKLNAQGDYLMDQDMCHGIFPDMARDGYMFEVPSNLSVGQTLKSSTVKQEYKALSAKQSSELTYNDVKVVREEDITVAAGTFHCYVITGTYSGTMGSGGKLTTTNLNASFTMWLTPGIGIVSYEVNYGSPITYELNEISGI